MSKATRDLAHYLNLPYTTVLRLDEEGDWVARIQELEGCVSHGNDQEDALVSLREVQEAWIKSRLQTGKSIPKPESEEELPSGKWLQRVPRSLHKKLVETAANEQVSLNQLVTSMLSEAVSTRPYMKALPVTVENLHPEERPMRGPTRAA
ncbi:MAG: toxin-antitoxin system HicB family antitoxin [Bryobacteraceae bacterium]|jgi:antitoxin HicB